MPQSPLDPRLSFAVVGGCADGLLKAYGANVRRDFAHKTSRALVQSDAQVLVFEDLKLHSMTRAPKPKVKSKGRYVANGVAAKAESNNHMLFRTLGLVK